eukprot:4551410-Pyramimonas_sp.AAC.2
MGRAIISDVSVKPTCGTHTISQHTVSLSRLVGGETRRTNLRLMVRNLCPAGPGNCILHRTNRLPGPGQELKNAPPTTVGAQPGGPTPERGMKNETSVSLSDGTKL